MHIFLHLAKSQQHQQPYYKRHITYHATSFLRCKNLLSRTARFLSEKCTSLGKTREGEIRERMHKKEVCKVSMLYIPFQKSSQLLYISLLLQTL